MTAAGTLPRSLTLTPVLRAQERTSELVGWTEGLAGLRVRDPPEDLSATAVRVRCFVLAVTLLGLVARFCDGLFVRVPSSDTTTVTPYRAPTTRSASSIGSLESTVSLNAFPLRYPLARTPTGE